MLHIKASGSTIEKFPYTESDLRAEFPLTGFGRPIPSRSFIAKGRLPVEDVAKPDVNAGQIAVRNQLPTISDGSWSWGWTVRAETSGELEAAKAVRLAELADIRWTAEESGTTLSGTPIATDRTTQGKLTAAYVKAEADATYAIANWKFGPGTFGPLDAATIIAAADAVEAHVQACFTNEASLTTAISEASTIAAVNAIDLDAGWP